jgi:hypothetical protein
MQSISPSGLERRWRPDRFRAELPRTARRVPYQRACVSWAHGGAWDHLLRTRILLSGGARHFRSAFHSGHVAMARMARDASMLCVTNALLCQRPHHEPGRAGADLGGAGLYIHQVDYRQTGMFEYKMVVSTFALKNFKALAGTLVCLTSLISTSRPPRNSSEPSKKAALLVIYRGPHDQYPSGVEA